LPQPDRSVEERLAASAGSDSLSPKTRALMEPRFGYDFGAVRVHADRQADSVAKGLNAEAFTVGPDIYFRNGKYAPHTRSGQWLLAHELTHVVQQQGGANVSRFTQVSTASLQRFSLKGFPPAEEAQMNSAVPAAKSVVSSCKKLSAPDQSGITSALDSLRFDWVPDLEYCGVDLPAFLVRRGRQESFRRRQMLRSALHARARSVAQTVIHRIGSPQDGVRLFWLQLSQGRYRGSGRLSDAERPRCVIRERIRNVARNETCVANSGCVG